MLLPDPMRRGEINFVFAKSLPYNYRLGIMVGLLAAGFAVQVFVGLGWGAPLILAGSLLAVVRGFDNLVGSPTGRCEWRGAEISQLENIAEISYRARRWDQSMLDITCSLGAATFLVVAGLVGAAWWLLMRDGQIWLSNAVVFDAALVLVPHWFTGVRRILTNAPLTIKVEELLYVHDLWNRARREDEDMTAQMEVRRTADGEVPTDAKLILKLPPLGDSFLGLQVQVVLNNVQGRDYPYVYCVLVARPDLGMLDKLDPDPPEGVVVETKSSEDVDIIIVRQYTTKTSGYHSKRPAVSRIFSFARGEARKLLTK